MKTFEKRITELSIKINQLVIKGFTKEKKRVKTWSSPSGQAMTLVEIEK